MSSTKSLLIRLVIASATVAGCGREPVDRFRELEIVEDDVVASDRAKNELDGAFSFRHVMRSLAGSDEAASVSVRETFQAMGDATAKEVVCPWLRADATNDCDATCASCTSWRLDLSRAPLRLLAISNRVDLGDKPDAISKAGEARFVYGVTSGPGDDPRSAPRGMTLIVEYALPSTRTPGDWARAWHQLGGLEGARYLDGLEALTNEITSARTLAQVRTNAAAGEPDPGMRELAVDEEGHLRPRRLRNTPDPSLDRRDALAAFKRLNAEAILADEHVLPLELRASRIGPLAATPANEGVATTTSGISADVRRAFDAGTCDGCHGREERAVDDVFHVSPFRRGPDKLSRFLHDPDAKGVDDLARREADLRTRIGR